MIEVHDFRLHGDLRPRCSFVTRDGVAAYVEVNGTRLTVEQLEELWDRYQNFNVEDGDE
jgi:hypothetical protein